MGNPAKSTVAVFSLSTKTNTPLEPKVSTIQGTIGKIFLAALLAVVFAGAAASSAQAATFTSAGSGDWASAATWTQNSVPGLNDDVTVQGGHTVTVSSNQNVHNLTVNSPGTLTLNADLTCTGNTFLDSYNARVNGTTGTLRMNGTTQALTLSSDPGNAAGFGLLVPLEIVTGTTTLGTGPFNGLRFDQTLTVDSGATFKLAIQVTLNANLTNNGIISGTVSFSYSGATLTNGGTINVNDFYFSRAGTQTLSGLGTFGGTTNFHINGGTTLVIPSATTIGGNQFIVHSPGTLTLNADLTYTGNTFQLDSYNARVNGTGTLRMNGTTQALTLDSDPGNAAGFGLLVPLEIVTGTTTLGTGPLNGLRFDQTLTVDSGATFKLAIQVTLNANLTNNGIISGTVSFSYSGATLTNGGTINVNNFYFSRAGTQTLSGSGTFGGTTNFHINGGTTLVIPSATTIGGNQFIVHSPGTLTLNADLTYTGNTFQLDSYNARVNGTGTLRMNGTTQALTLDSDPGAVAGFGLLVPLEIVTGTTKLGTGPFNGLRFDQTLTTDTGATFQLNIGLTFNNATLTGNGTISGTTFTFGFAGTTTVSGTGGFSSANSAVINAGTTVLLGSDHQFGILTNNGTLNITGRILKLSGAGTPITNNGTITQNTTSTFEYDGTSAQTVQTTNITYNNLKINNAAGVTLPAAITIPATLTLTNGVFTISSNLTMGNGALIRRSDGSLSGTPNFGASVNVEYFGANAITTGTELPASAIVLNNLTINNSAGVNASANQTVNGTLALNSGDLNMGSFTLMMPNTANSNGTTDVIGNVRRTGFITGGGALSFGNPNNLITINFGATPPTDITVNLAKTSNSGAGLTQPSITRTYTITTNNGSAYNARLRLHYRDTELNGNSEPSLQLYRFNVTWVNQGKGAQFDDGPAEQNWVERNNVTQFSPWTIANGAPTAAGGVVTGRIVDQSGNPVEGAVVRLEGTQNRKFITDANGFYRFENVETNGFYTVAPSRVNYTFSPSTRSFSQIGETTEATFGAAFTGQNANPLDTPEYFVRQHYLDFLGREPDEAGFNFWSDQMIECATDQNCIERRRENVSAAYFLSIEFQQTGGLVDGLYRASYGTSPQNAAFMPDTRTVGLGVVVGQDGWEAKLRANKEAFANAFVNRAAFHQMYDGMDNSLFVDTLIQHTGVTFTSSERDALVSGLGTGTMTRGDAARSIAENSRFVSAKFNEAFVMMEYFGYLRRDPDASGFAFWLNKLNQFNGNFEHAEMVKAFITSTEYRQRFGH